MKASWIIDALVQQGVVHFCTAPGSRSTPLVDAALRHKQATLHVHYDERGLGFFALGLSKALEAPAAIIVTSGTAVGNLLPACMEAHHSYTPLILLTADRPAELRACGANQTAHQTNIFGSFTRWQIDLPNEMNERYFRSTIADAVFHTLTSPKGPVHINCPFQEPFYTPPLEAVAGKPVQLHIGRVKASPLTTNASKGVILIGALPNKKDVLPILQLGQTLNWPILADILSTARLYPIGQQIRSFDYIDKPTPDIILHFGERMTSKKILEWLNTLQVEMIHISPNPRLQDPARLVTSRVQSDILEFCQTFEAGYDPAWLNAWEDQPPTFLETGVFTEVHMMQTLSQLIPQDFAVFLGSGMPIRDADHFLFPKKGAGFFANRGLSVIDGNIASLAGIGEFYPTLGVIGDQAALYDINSLPLLKKTKKPVILLISNNFGGGIFHHLPIANSPHFETFWAAQHNYTFEKIANFMGLPYFPFQELHKAFQRNTSAMIELITDRAQNYQYQKNTCSMLKP